MSLLNRVVAAAMLILTFAGCGGGGGGGDGGSSGSSSVPGPPVASAAESVSQGTAPLSVTFDASGSNDPAGHSLSYTWSFSDGSNATGVAVSHTFQNHGTYTASVTVNDGQTSANSTPLQIVVSAAPPSISSLAISVNVLGVAPTASQGQLLATDRENLPVTFSLASPPTSGTAAVNSATGAISYTVPGFVTSATDSFVVQVTNGLAQASGTVTLTLKGDPLLPYQWHIQNTGHDAFSSVLPVAGNDMDVAGAWVSGFSGNGVKVGVVDSGLQASHEDLSANVDLSHSYNFLTGSNDPTPTVAGEDHGTQVAGIIGAVAFNGVGGRGVAYKATLRGYNLLAPGVDDSVANLAKSLGADPVSSDNDVFNESFSALAGLYAALPSFSGAYQSVTANAATLRGGLGAAFIQAAGNDFLAIEGSSATLCQIANQYNVSCGDPASDERRGGDYPLIVGALNASGVHSSYSSTGSSLWISAPGGEYGWNSVESGSITATPAAAPYVLLPAITTTALTGCSNYTSAYNPLDSLGNNPLASQCQYTAVMNGTSSATPNVSAVVAMMLEANPKLSVRDIKYILASTAKKVDPNFGGVSSTSVVPGNTIVLEQGWVTNSAGYTFSNRYGFGAVSASAAVSAAKSYASFLPAQENSTGTYQFVAAPPATIAKDATGNYLQFQVSEGFTTVESAIVIFNMQSTPVLSCNQIELTSPSGTKSILLHAANGFTNVALANTRFETNAFYGEAVNGIWTLRFYDFCTTGPLAGTATTLSTTEPQVLLLTGR